MGDKTLLELAAKAAGYEIIRWLKDTCGAEYAECRYIGRTATFYWQPLYFNEQTDCDGDALRLAVKLGFGIDIDNKSKETAVSYTFPRDLWMVEIFKNNANAATRRAIVRAAAEIGKSM